MELKEKLTQMRTHYAKQLEGCEAKLEALGMQREQIRGAIFAIDQALTEEKPTETKKES